jgi:hypothetical protein
MRVLDHQGSHARALTVFQRLNDCVMLAVRIEQVVVHARKVNFFECNGMRCRKGDSRVAIERGGDHLAASSFHDQRMELPIHVAVPGFVRQDQVPFSKDFISLTETLMQRADETAGWPLFRQHASRQALKRAPDVNRIHDFLRRKCSYDKTPSIKLSQYAFLREHGQSFTHRSPGNSKLGRKFNLSYSLARRQFSVQDHFPYSYDYS